MPDAADAWACRDGRVQRSERVPGTGACSAQPRGQQVNALWLCDLASPWRGPVLANLQSWRAWRGDVQAWRHYWTGPLGQRPSLPAGAAWETLRPGTDLLGPAVMADGGQAPCHYVVETDVAPGAEDEFHAWYEQEHLPGLSQVPGCLRARRLVRPDGPAGYPLHLACYDLLDEQVTESEPWLAVRHTAWSQRVRPLFRNTRRTLFVQPAHTPT